MIYHLMVCAATTVGAQINLPLNKFQGNIKAVPFYQIARFDFFSPGGPY